MYSIRMCTRYIPPHERDIERDWHIGNRNPYRWWEEVLHPQYLGPFVRRSPVGSARPVELVIGQWGLIPAFSATPQVDFPTSNARSEELLHKPSYRHPWLSGQRCLIPAASFDEPCWETGSNVWWRFHRADGRPWALAGLWNTWVDRVTGQPFESYSMLTVNADDHPVMSRMHKPKLDPTTRRPRAQQDKRSVVSIEARDVGAWLFGTVQQAQRLLTPPAVEHLKGEPHHDAHDHDLCTTPQLFA